VRDRVRGRGHLIVPGLARQSACAGPVALGPGDTGPSGNGTHEAGLRFEPESPVAGTPGEVVLNVVAPYGAPVDDLQIPWSGTAPVHARRSTGISETPSTWSVVRGGRR
jgi:hypothetical protein